MSNELKEIKVLCPFCSEPQSAKLEAEIFEVHTGCDTCGYGSGSSGEINVYCENCKRLIYTKEFDN